MKSANKSATVTIGYAVQYWSDRSVRYVSELPGHGGKDWGWGDRESAIALSPYWQRRLTADLKSAGRLPHGAQFVDVPSEAARNYCWHCRAKRGAKAKAIP